MQKDNKGNRVHLMDRIAKASLPTEDESDVSTRRAWWWIFFMPGKVILWLEYMFPSRIPGVFGSARRRNVPLLQIMYSIYFYVSVMFFIFVIFITFSSRK